MTGCLLNPIGGSEYERDPHWADRIRGGRSASGGTREGHHREPGQVAVDEAAEPRDAQIEGMSG
jgi:hypothetical protein